MFKHEFFEELGSQHSYDKNSHGRSGAIHTPIPNYRCEVETPWLEAYQEVLSTTNSSPRDAWSGDYTGVYTSLCTVDQSSAKGTRSYAVTGYLVPALKRSNLKVLAESQVTHVILQQGSQTVKATDVEFLKNGQTYNCPLSSGQSSMGFASYPSIATNSEVDHTASLISSNNTGLDPKQAKIEVDRLRSPNSACIHLYGVAATFNLDQGHDCSKYFAPPPPGARRFTMGVSLQYPFLRGTVRIKSSNTLEHPDIDPARSSSPLRRREVRRQMLPSSTTQGKVTKRQIPPPSVDLNDQAQVENYVRTHTKIEFHLIGTATTGKVVDDRLRVKGLKGI
ncbi:MAG: hypothetical protein Q9167_002991 [Letrouitia subvulpina]